MILKNYKPTMKQPKASTVITVKLSFAEKHAGNKEISDRVMHKIFQLLDTDTKYFNGKGVIDVEWVLKRHDKDET